jgi:phosphatidylglycerophosphatase C
MLPTGAEEADLPIRLRNTGVASGFPATDTAAAVTIAVYDLDRTLTRRGTWVPWLAFWLRREAPWRALLLPLLLLPAAGFALRLVSRGGLKAAAHRLAMGRRVARARIETVAAAYAQQVLAGEIFPGALAALAADRAAGRRLVLATASNDYYAGAIAARLGFDMAVATPSRWHEDGLDWRLGGANNYGREKARRLAEALPGDGFVFVSDHVSDLPSFELALAGGGAAVAANPSPALRRLALARGWTVIDWGRVEGSWLEQA